MYDFAVSVFNELTPGLIAEVSVTFIFVLFVVFIFKSDLVRPGEPRPDPNEERRRRAMELIKKSEKRALEEKKLKSRLNAKGRG
ncbi:MAG: hypothetical protein ACTTIC_02810 [Helicobacteraceae bacterium]